MQAGAQAEHEPAEAEQGGEFDHGPGQDGDQDEGVAGERDGSGAGALSRREYLEGLAAAVLAGASVTVAAGAAPGLHPAVIGAVKPAAA